MKLPGMVLMVTLAALGCVRPAGAAPEAGEAERELRLAIHLRDGSIIVGVPATNTVAVRTSYARMDVLLGLLTEIEFSEADETCALIFRNGDRVQGVIDAQAFELHTLIGEISIPVEFVRWIAPPAPSGMVLIPAGVNSGIEPDDGAYSLANAAYFYMDKYEVTKALWDSVTNWNGANGYDYGAGHGLGKGANHPVHTVDWFECLKWCNARSEKAGRTPVYYTDAGFTQVYRSGKVLKPYVNASADGYRLPTAVEWQYAARGGVSSKRFSWGGDTISHDHANYRANSIADHIDTSPYTSDTHHPDWDDEGVPYTSPVGTFEMGKNGYGLYDMTGNVWEWCYDSYPPNVGSSRVRRGGSWSRYAYYCRIAIRSHYSPDRGYNGIGFRTVLPPGQ